MRNGYSNIVKFSKNPSGFPPSLDFPLVKILECLKKTEYAENIAEGMEYINKSGLIFGPQLIKLFELIPYVGQTASFFLLIINLSAEDIETRMLKTIKKEIANEISSYFLLQLKNHRKLAKKYVERNLLEKAQDQCFNAIKFD